MKYFLATITTHYDGLEWLHYSVTKARNIENAQKKFDKKDWTHDNGIEEQDEAVVQEITKQEYETFGKILVIV